jgi:hypothetical protein
MSSVMRHETAAPLTADSVAAQEAPALWLTSGRQGALPIVVALCGDTAVREQNVEQTRQLLERELHTLQQRYPHSPIALAAPSPLLHLAHAAACKAGAFAVAEECHATCDVLIESPHGGTSGTPRVRVTAPRRPTWEPSPAEHRDALERTDLFNREALRCMAQWPEDIVASARSLAVPEGVEVPDAAKRLRDVFAVANLLALHAQKRMRWALYILFGIGVVATILFAMFHIYDLKSAGWAFGSTVLLGVGAYQVAKRSKVHERYVEYRTLAESARIQFYWRACGVPDCTRDHCTAQLPTNLAWIHDALLSIVRSSGVAASPISADALRATLAGWIAEQGRYFRRSAPRAHRRFSRWNRLANGLFIAWVIVGGVLLLGETCCAASLIEWKWISFIAVLLPAFSAIIVGFLAKIAMGYQAKHYHRMASIYARAEAQLANAAPDELRRVAVELGRQALQENVQWAAVLTEQGIDPPPTPFTKRLE